LKTLEEPPPNTVFVLATTEANKVPATVVDRCHRFDFHRPTVEQIASVVRRAAAAESIEIPPEAVAALARSATGSFRDALGTLEQLVTYSGQEIALADVLAVLGVADARLLEATVDAVAAGDARRALRALEECVGQGRDAASFASDLEVRARELLVVQILGELPDELSLTPEADAALRAQAERVDHATVVRLLELLGEAMEGVRAGADARTRLELALVKAARPETDGSVRALLARIERLERGAGPAVASAVARWPRGARRSPRGAQRSPRGAQRSPRGAQRSPRGARRRRLAGFAAGAARAAGAGCAGPRVGVRDVAGGGGAGARRSRAAGGADRGSAPGVGGRRGADAGVCVDGAVLEEEGGRPGQPGGGGRGAAGDHGRALAAVVRAARRACVGGQSGGVGAVGGGVGGTLHA
jgi:DNA polymerase-3 subunit gamma/tau